MVDFVAARPTCGGNHQAIGDAGSRTRRTGFACYAPSLAAGSASRSARDARRNEAAAPTITA